MSSTPTTVNDPFDDTQGPATNPDTLNNTGGWTPVNSTRTIETSVAFGSVTDINVGDSGEWTSTLGFGQTAQIEYKPAPSTAYNLSGLLSIIVEGVSIDNNSGILFLTLESPNGTHQDQAIITNFSDNYSFQISDYEMNGVDTHNINLIRVVILNTSLNPEITATAISTGINFTLICVAKDTQILMADGTNKLIQNLERGDLVAGDTNARTPYKVARLLHNKLPGIVPVNMVTIEPNALGKNQPHTKLTITGAHPILFNGARNRALRFRKFPGVQYHSRKYTKAENILPANEDGTYSLYNIQFEHDGYFVANGLAVDSVPVLCPRLPLPKELFFNQELYNKPSTVVVPPLDKTVLYPRLFQTKGVDQKIPPQKIPVRHISQKKKTAKIKTKKSTTGKTYTRILKRKVKA